MPIYMICGVRNSEVGCHELSLNSEQSSRYIKAFQVTTRRGNFIVIGWQPNGAAFHYWGDYSGVVLFSIEGYTFSGL